MNVLEAFLIKYYFVFKALLAFLDLKCISKGVVIVNLVCHVFAPPRLLWLLTTHDKITKGWLY